MAKKKIRVPATTVQLVQILGDIIRNHIKISLYDTECWTFEHVADYEVRWEEPDPDAGETEWLEYLNYGNPEHSMNVYLGSGKVFAFGYHCLGDPKQLDLRVRCEHSHWEPTAQKYWDLQIWIKPPNGPIQQHHFTCHLGYGTCRSIFSETDSKMSQRPPRKIDFWRQKKGEARAS